jgi:hypothetical protein
MWTSRDENMLEVENRTVRPEKYAGHFMEFPGFHLLQCFLRELHSTRHGSSMETSFPWFANSSPLGGMQGEEN